MLDKISSSDKFKQCAAYGEKLINTIHAFSINHHIISIKVAGAAGA